MSEVVLFEPPYKADEEPAAYEIKFEPAPKQVRVVFADHVVAKSENAMVLRETRLAPVHYLPAEDVDERYLEASEHRTYCPFKGTARYWHLVVGERKSENAVWSYDEPTTR